MKRRYRGSDITFSVEGTPVLSHSLGMTEIDDGELNSKTRTAIKMTTRTGVLATTILYASQTAANTDMNSSFPSSLMFVLCRGIFLSNYWGDQKKSFLLGSYTNGRPTSISQDLVCRIVGAVTLTLYWCR